MQLRSVWARRWQTNLHEEHLLLWRPTAIWKENDIHKTAQYPRFFWWYDASSIWWECAANKWKTFEPVMSRSQTRLGQCVSRMTYGFLSSIRFWGVFNLIHKECDFATYTFPETWPGYAIYTDGIDEGKWFTCRCHKYVCTPTSATSTYRGEYAEKQTTNSNPLLFPMRWLRHTVNDQTKAESNVASSVLQVRMQVKKSLSKDSSSQR